MRLSPHFAVATPREPEKSRCRSRNVVRSCIEHHGSSALACVPRSEWHDGQRAFRERPTYAAFDGRGVPMVSSGTEGGDHRARLGAGAIASLSGIVLLLVFIVQNTNDVKLSFLVWDFTWPLWLLTIVSAILGALVWFGLGVMRRHRRRKERRADRRD